jgi:hypothetical protein
VEAINTSIDYYDTHTYYIYTFYYFQFKLATMLESVKLTPTLWPDSLPHPKEEKIISVFCGSTNIKWALHEGAGMNFSPSCCWR